MNSDTIVVMGNGPSLKDIDFSVLEQFDTFGLNSAYRAYERLNWWPTYHGCFDYVVTESHKENFINLIDNSPIKKCFYIKNISQNSDKFQFVNLSKYGTTNKWNSTPADFNEFHDNGNSGANSCSAAACMGYKKIILVGVDCNYVEHVDGSAQKGTILEMEETPDTNPNYWFDDYQQKGDQYNIPDGIKFHLPTWNMFAYRAAHAGISVVNCSPISTLRCFKRMSLEDAIKQFKE
tara:strand:- start:31472 stop:32176 length:705 start_codon:yes stop_codon:yes gene_type:complete